MPRGGDRRPARVALSIVDVTTVATLSGLVGVIMGAGAILAVRATERAQAAGPPPSESALPAGVGDVLAVLRSSGIVVDASDRVVNTSPTAVAQGLVRDHDLVHAELRHLARQVRRDGVIREVDLDLARGPLGHGHVLVHARVAPLGADHVLLLIEDQTRARRVEEVRRDFISNVSHELKTPVGGLSLLAEAIQDAKGDPEAVVRFGGRMRVEADRLNRLIQEIVDFSRLQGDDSIDQPALVDVDRVVSEALDRTKLAADAKDIDLVGECAVGLAVFGDEGLLVTAVRNLLSNAVSYSERHTRVSVIASRVDDTAQIVVTDQGAGIPTADQDRIFERFYRVDPARSRATGGTGLGLSIVKHICENHGGDVTVWSEEGHGSTFTIRLPLAERHLEQGDLPA